MATEMGGIDARDWFRGLRPWDQFLNSQTLANREGTQLWAAQLNDDRFLPEIRKKLAGKNKPDAPSLAGYTRLVSAIDQLTDHVYMLRAETGKWGSGAARPRAKPSFPSDRIEDEKVVKSRKKIGDILDRAHSLGRR